MDTNNQDINDQTVSPVVKAADNSIAPTSQGQCEVVVDSTFVLPTRENAPPLPSKPRPTISYAIEDGTYRPTMRASISNPPPQFAQYSQIPRTSLAPISDANAASGGVPSSSIPGANTSASSAHLPVPNPAIPWTQESPQFWQKVVTLKAACVRFSNRLRRDNAAIGKECLCSTPLPLRHYADTMKEVVDKASHVIKPLVPVLEKDPMAIARLIGNLSDLRTQLKIQLEASCQPEEELFEIVKHVHEQHTRYEEQKQRHIEKLKSFLQLKPQSEAKRIYDKSIKLNVMEQYLESERFNLYREVNEINDHVEYFLLKPLGDRLQAYYDFFSQGMALLEPYKEFIANLSTVSNTLAQNYKTGKYQYDLLREKITSSSSKVFEEERPTDGGIAALLGLSKKNNTSGSGSGGADKDDKTAGIRDLEHGTGKVSASVEYKSGYLFLPSRDYERIWVEIQDDMVHMWNATKTEEIMSIQLMLCTVKQARESKLRYVFTIITPQQSVVLQAESEASMFSWIDSIQSAIGKSLHRTDDSGKTGGGNHRGSISGMPGGGAGGAGPDVHGFGNSNQNVGAAAVLANMLAKRLSVQHPDGVDGVGGAGGAIDDTDAMVQSLWSTPGNEVCVDCGAAKPDWLSLNLGIMICLECSSAHRLMSVNTSKVRSATMDVIDICYIRYIQGVGNTLVNTILLENIKPEDQIRINASTSRGDRIKYITRKYQEKAFMDKNHLKHGIEVVNLSDFTSDVQRQQVLDQTLFLNIQHGCLIGVYECIMKGANVDYVSEEDEHRTCVHEALMYAEPNVAMVTLLYSNNLSAQDDRGWTPLHYAAYSNRAILCEMCLLIGGSDLTAQVDYEGKNASTLARVCNVGEEYEAELPFVLQVLTKYEEKYQAKLRKSNNN